MSVLLEKQFGNDHNSTDKSLAEQMHITDREIESRKALLGITKIDEGIMLSLKEHVTTHANEIANMFYTSQLEVPEITLMIGDSDSLRRLQDAMRRYLLELFEGYYDVEYVNKRLMIGKVHKRIGVSPKLYVSAIVLLQSVIEEVLSEKVPLLQSEEGRKGFRHALTRFLMFDMQLVFDTYIQSLVAEVEQSRASLEDYAESLEEIVAERTEQLREQSVRDELTGLYNHRYLHEVLRRECAMSERANSALCLVYFDLNKFKQVNDTKGHKEGDRILMLVGEVIKKSIREVDIACRYGGDEFCVILPRTDLTEARLVCHRNTKTFDE